MATYTTNYNLEKPEASDPFGDFRQSYNGNLDIIDQHLGGGGGSSSLAGLSDVDLTTPTDGQVLTYDGNSSKWVNANGGGGGGDVMDVEVNGVSVVDGNKVAKITSYKEITQEQYDALPASKLTDGIAYFIKDGGGSGSGGSFLLVITADTGETVTATKDGTTLTATEVSTGVYEVEVTSAGTWTLSDGTNTATVDVGIYTATLSSVPEGSTVLPTDDVSIWLACGERTEGYTTLSQVLGDSVCLSALLNNNNANDYLVRSTTWASTITADSSAMTYIGLNNYCSNTLLSDSTWRTAICNSTYFESVLNAKVPVMTSNTAPEGVASTDSMFSSNYDAWKAFNGIDTINYGWCPADNNPHWVQYEFTEPVYIKKILYRGFQYSTSVGAVLCGSNNNIDYTDLLNIPNPVSQTSDIMTALVEDNTNTKYTTIRVRHVPSNGSGYRFQFYGRKDI